MKLFQGPRKLVLQHNVPFEDGLAANVVPFAPTVSAVSHH